MVAPLLLTSGLVASLLPVLPAQAATSIAKINFQPSTFTTPTGYTADTGLPYTAARGFGWIDQSDSNPLDMTANTRSGNSIPPAYTKVSDMMMQPKGAASGRWEYAIANGTYNVTLTVGDARMSSGTNYCCIDGTMRLSVEGVEVVNDFVASAATPLQTTSANIAVADGKLTVDAVGGINTKFDHIEIAAATGPAQGAGPLITGVTPAAGTTGVALNTAVSLAVSAPVDLSTVTAANVKLTSSAGQVAGNYNADAAGGTVSFTPGANLAVNTVYTVTVTSGLKGADGQSFGAFTSTFTTGTAPPPLATTAFSKLMSVSVPKPNVVLIGPDGKLYVGCAGGQIYRFTRAADGSLSSPEVISPFGNRVITGLAFDPVTPTRLWVTNGYAGYTNAPPMSGHVSSLTIAAGQPLTSDVASARDVIIGLPRSMHDHMTNGLAFGPDGKLYIAQGANTSYGGAPDPYWGARGEAPLTASILVADVDSTAVFPSGTTLNVNTDPVGFTEATGSDTPVGYNPKAAGAPLTVFASGTRNPFTLMWDSNGKLYAPVNESAAGGVTPAGPGNVPVSVSNIQAYTDYFTRVQAGKYYGHPNATQGYYALNGGNPTAAGDPYEVTEYPVGTQPDANWQAPDFAMGVHRSPDGAAEYTNSSAFSGALKGKILVSEYSDGDDIVAFSLDGNGKPVSEASLPDANNPGQALIFNNPLGLAVDSTSGVVYVAEHLDETSSVLGQVTVIVPSTGGGTVNNGVHVNFQPSSVTAPTGYAADTGAPFNGQMGWQDFSGNPIDLTANTRVAHAAASPDVRFDTDLLMQAPSGSGNTTPGQWATTLPNGSYDVTVAVGDPLATNSVDEIVAQPGTADAVTVIDHFAPSVATPWSTVTKRVQVTNGVLVLSPVGGTNTKIDFVDAVPATTDTLSPSVTLSLAGTLTSGTTYSGPVTVTASAVDNVGVTSTSYVLDGGAPTPYTAPVVVSAAGSHTITVTAKDAAGNPGVATQSFTVAAVTAAGSLHVNFAAQTSAAVAGYTTDFGAAFTAAGGGWEDQSTGAPVSAIGNGRDRGSNLSPDKRYDTFVQMQELASSTTGTHTPVRWEHAIANGTYAVTVAVGDATATNSVDKITAEPGTANSTVIINNFQATSSVLFQTMTKTVTVSDGLLTLSAVGGTNTKLDFVDAVPVDTTPPTAAISLAGPLISGTNYSGTVSATVSAADEAGGSGLVSVLYSVDGGTATPYTTVVPISGKGPHAIAVTAKDGAGNTTTAASTFTITPPDPTAPTASIALAGPSDGTNYTGDVTATVTSADEPGGSGLASTTYVLDSASSAFVTGPITVSGLGSHTLTVTAMDNAGNVTTVGKTFAIVAPQVDTTDPTGSIDLAGSFDGTTYTGDVTATVTAADEAGGSGVATTTYVLDGASSLDYTAPLVVSAPGDHTLVVTITDHANNSFTVEKDWSSVAAPVDTIDPTVSLDLGGTVGGPGYIGDVTATATAADQGGSGLASTTYVLDGAAAKPYTTAVVVSSAGDHTMTVTAKDGAGNTATATQTWSSVLLDTTDPAASISLAGPLYTGSIYGGDVTATVAASDAGSGLASTTYVLDSDPSAPYTVPVVVTGTGPHTLTVTATDNQGNSTTTAKSWTQQTPDTTNPTASVTLGGNKLGATYLGDVTATLAAADEAGGSGLASATYVLDAASAKPVGDPVVVSAAGNHTLTVTATDYAGNTATATQTWTSQLVDNTNPTVSLALSGALYSGTTYGGNVTVTATAADNAGGSGLAPTTYVLDGASATYSAPVVVTTTGPHTLTVTATDNQGNTATATKTWSQTTVDNTKPTAAVVLGGTVGSGGIYTGSVTATITSSDELGGSGLKTTTYSLDGAPATAYTAPVVVTAVGSHTLTVTATDNAGNVGTATSAWNQATSGGTAKLVVTSPDDAVLANASTPRLVFSAVRGLGATPAKAFTFTNNGTGTLTVSNLAIGGTNASSWKLNTGQATSIVIAAGDTATVSLLFTPTDPTGCASTASPYAIGDVDRNATLTFTTNDATQPTGSALLSGVNSCYVGGNNEPVLDQLLPELGYTDVVDSPGGDRRYIGPLRYLPNTDEIQSPYFTAANAALPVSVIPLTHYGSANSVPYQATGYYAAGSAMTQPKSTCSSACKTLWQFPADTISGGVTTYNQNQKLLPSVTGVTTFTAPGTFGLFSGDFTDVNFSDDSLNVGHTTANVNLPVPHYLHDLRVFPAYGPGHVAIPNTYIVGIDLSRVPAYKNNDFQDIVLLVRNVTPALTQGPLPGAATTANLAAGGSVSAACAVTGFDGVLANTGGTQCNAANLAFTPTGLQLTSTAGQLANSNQQNALYKTFDATHNQFTVTARVLGPLTALTTDYQQIAAFFGPDQKNFVKVEAEHNGTGAPHVTMFYSEKGVAGTVATVAVPELLTATTVDLIITGNGNLPDPLPYGDTYGVHAFPLDQVTVSYSINGGTPVVVGTAKAPADVTGWFSRQAKAGILVSNSGTTTPIAVTFSRFAITAP
ncbi:hypothetical protein acdb102_15710 [Acidothermaceae bacterium B102]|nr:hypothetical protein acdb102_15710 [Acidothermaceae bacterium B102]